MTKKHILLSSLIVMIIFFSLSCREESKFGYELLPDSDKFKHLITDTISIDLFTLKDDSVIVSQADNLLVGSYEDPEFGHTSASSLVQFRLPNSIVPVPNIVVDSIVLVLSYTTSRRYYGDTLSEQILNFNIASRYIEGDSVITAEMPNIYSGGDQIGSISVKPELVDSILTLQVKLDDSFAQSFFSVNPEGFFDNDAFLAFLPGIYISPENPAANAAIFSFDSNTASLNLHYHQTTSPDYSDSYDFTSDSKSEIALAHINFFDHNYESLPFYNTLIENAIPSKIAYAQSMAGLRVKIKMPYLSELSKLKGSIIIHRAQLIIPANDTENSNIDDFAPPPSVFFNLLDTEDYPLQPGLVQPRTNESEYTIDLADYVSGIMDNTTENNGLLMSVYNSSRNSSRLVISTEITNPQRARLVITYAKLPEIKN